MKHKSDKADDEFAKTMAEIKRDLRFIRWMMIITMIGTWYLVFKTFCTG